jgi:hypothetical protein
MSSISLKVYITPFAEKGVEEAIADPNLPSKPSRVRAAPSSVPSERQYQLSYLAGHSIEV